MTAETSGSNKIPATLILGHGIKPEMVLSDRGAGDLGGTAAFTRGIIQRIDGNG